MRKEVIAQGLLDIVNPEEKKEDKPYRAYLPSPFISASLPLRDVKSPIFSRKYNNIEMILTGAPKVPYGVYGRLVLSLLTTKAVLGTPDENGNVLIEYSKEKDFLNELQAPSSRGKNYREQLEYFANTTFVYKAKIKKVVQKSLFENLDTNKKDIEVSYESTGNVAFIKRYDRATIIDSDIPAEERKRNMAILLNGDFVKLCKEHAVPINYTTYSKLNSAIAKDLYAWFVYRNNSLPKGGELRISRDAVLEQFNPVNKDSENVTAQKASNFQKIQEYILDIKKYYPGLNVSTLPKGSGIILRKSEAEIINDDTRYMLITAIEE